MGETDPFRRELDFPTQAHRQTTTAAGPQQESGHYKKKTAAGPQQESGNYKKELCESAGWRCTTGMQSKHGTLWQIAAVATH